MKPYAVELGEELGEKLRMVAEKRHLTLTGLARQVMWSYFERIQADEDTARSIAKSIKAESQIGKLHKP